MPDHGTTDGASRTADGDLCLDKATFSHPTANTGHRRPQVFDALDLQIPAGGTIAIIRSTDAGKSTTIKLSARLYDPVGGVVRASEANARDFPFNNWRHALSYIPQESHLFSGTVAINISYGLPDSSHAEVQRAARNVGALNTIAGLPGDFHHPVGLDGRGLSSGQRQLIVLAHAEMIRPELLLLDKAAATLDPAAESAILEAADCTSRQRSITIVAHRLATTTRTGRILVLDHGRIVEDGSHDELLMVDGRYAEFWSKYHMGSTMV